MVEYKFYDPSNIFKGDNNPNGLTGEENLSLATSFYHSRRPPKSGHLCNYDHERDDEFDRNAGALQLYKDDGVSIYKISEKLEKKEYHFISYGNKFFKGFSQVKATSYGHSERMLMREVLDDLIHNDNSDRNVEAPSSIEVRYSSPKEKQYKILQNLVSHAEEYKEYLKSRNIIVKMWSERPACTEESNQDGLRRVGGGNCTDFMEKICPEGSQFGFIVKDYKPEDNQFGAPRVEKTFTAFANAYEAYIKSRNSCSSSSPGRKRKHSE